MPDLELPLIKVVPEAMVQSSQRFKSLGQSLGDDIAVMQQAIGSIAGSEWIGHAELSFIPGVQDFLKRAQTLADSILRIGQLLEQLRGDYVATDQSQAKALDATLTTTELMRARNFLNQSGGK